MGWIVNKRKVNDNMSVAVIEIKDIDDNLSKLIDNLIISICYGRNSIDYDLNYIKKQLYNNLTKGGKVTSDVKRGAIAEFFIHIYLNSNHFKQECFYLNLEEPKSIKKGFDGFYSFHDEEWIMESKSGSSSTVNVSHKGKVEEAYTDLKKKFSSKENENDPWRNAYMHAGHEDLTTNESIKSRLRECAKKFAKNEPIDISNYNIIPASTIYIVDNSYTIPSVDVLINDVSQAIKKFEHKEILVICVTQHSVDIFVEYLRKA